MHIHTRTPHAHTHAHTTCACKRAQHIRIHMHTRTPRTHTHTYTHSPTPTPTHTHAHAHAHTHTLPSYTLTQYTAGWLYPNTIHCPLTCLRTPPQRCRHRSQASGWYAAARSPPRHAPSTDPAMSMEAAPAGGPSAPGGVQPLPCPRHGQPHSPPPAEKPPGYARLPLLPA